MFLTVWGLHAAREAREKLLEAERLERSKRGGVLYKLSIMRSQACLLCDDASLPMTKSLNDVFTSCCRSSGRICGGNASDRSSPSGIQVRTFTIYLLASINGCQEFKF